MPEHPGWVAPETVQAITATDTDTLRLAGGRGFTVELYGPACLVSSADPPNPPALAALLDRIDAHARECNLPVPENIFLRALAVGPGPENAPVRVRGAGGPGFEARESGLVFGVEFAGGYSCGLFPDQRGNRSAVRASRPRRLLNCFAFTCAFSVAAAACGAESVSIDLSKRALARGRENFARNHLDTTGHRFLADDVFDVLPRLARRGERFDAIILDPPTFSRGSRGRVFRAETDFPRLLHLALDCAAPGAEILLSTNCSKLTPSDLAGIAGRAIPSATVRPCLPPADCRLGPAASCAWLHSGKTQSH